MKATDEKDLLFSRFLAEESDGQDNEELYRWLSASASNMHEFILYKRTWEHFSPQMEEEEEIDAVYADLMRRIHKDRSRKVKVYGLAAAAATFLLLFGISFLFRENRQDTCLPDKGYLVTDTRMQKVDLPDGTVVWLNAGSRLEWSFGSGNRTRKTVLDGEAFFDVARDTSRPFTVHTEGMDIRVTGTRFNVVAYGDERFVEAVVAEGTVAVSPVGGMDRVYRLSADDRAVYNKDRESLGIDEVNAEDAGAWIRGELHFKEESLVRIAKVLERHFGVDICLASAALEKYVFTAAFEKGRSLEDILDVLSASSPMKYSRKGNHIIIHLKNELPMPD